MRFGSVSSGIEAASVAFGPLGWQAAWFSEIASFPSSVLAHHYPHVPNLGDMTNLPSWIRAGLIEAPDVLCGGTPCQSFSVAGKRESLSDARGNLSLTFCEIANAIDERRPVPAVILWENVPGVLSTSDNAFGCFLAELAGEDCPLEPPGGGLRWADAGAVYGPRRTVAWRVFDAQYNGLAQRRRRVFVVASARTDFDPVAVLFEWDGVRRDTPPSRGQGEETAGCLASRTDGGGFSGTDEACSGYVQPVAFGGNRTSGPIEVSPALLAQPGSGYKGDFESEAFIAVPHVDLMPTMTAGGPADTSHNQTSGQMRDQYLTPMAIRTAQTGSNGCGVNTDGLAYTLDSAQQAVAFDTTQITGPANRSNPKPGDPCHPLAAGAHPPAIAFDCKASGRGGFGVGDVVSTLRAMGHSDSHANGGGHAAVAVSLRGREGGGTAELGGDVQNCLRASGGGGDKPHVLTGMQVRRLTPRECERLQGFPDDYTRTPMRVYDVKAVTKNRPEDMWEEINGKWVLMAADGPRYKALGNSWAVPCVRRIGERIQRQLA